MLQMSQPDMPTHIVTTRIGDVPREHLSCRFIPAETPNSMELACEWHLLRAVEVTSEGGEITLYPAGEMVRRDGWVIVKAAQTMAAQQASIN